MSDYWKLDISVYTLDDLQEIFNLEQPYTIEDVKKSYETIQKNLKQDDSIDKKKRTDIEAFLTKGAAHIVKQIKKADSGLISSQTTTDHMVISHELQKEDNMVSINPMINTFASYTGKAIGGVSRPTYQKTISIDSKFRDNYYKTLSTDFSVKLPNKISNVLSMTLTGFELPNSYFQISEKRDNNYFWLGWQNEKFLTVNWYYINIPNGSYSADMMERIINEQIEKATGLPGDQCPQCSIISATKNTIFALPITADPRAFLQIAFNRSNGGYHITESAQENFNKPPIDNIIKINQKLGWILGFRLAEYKGNTSYVSEGLYDTWGPKYIYVIIDDFNKNFVNSVEPIYNASLGTDNVMARMGLSPILGSLGGLFMAAQGGASPQTRNYFGPVNIEKIHFKIVDAYGSVLDLNNMELSLALTFTCLYNN